MNAQSWFDLVVSPTMDPRSIIQTASLQDNGGTLRAATFARSSSWLVGGPWVPSILVPTAAAGALFPNVTVPNAYDYASIEEANAWNTLHLMTPANPASLAPPVTKITYLKAGTAFVNNLYLDFAVGKSSQNILLSFRDNSVTSGDFQNAGTGTVPVFAFPTTATYSGLGKNFQITLLAAGRYTVALLVLDNAGNYSMYEMDWIAV